MIEALKEFAEEAVAVVRAVMESDNGINRKVGKNTLIGSDIYNDADVADIELIQLFLNDYIDYIEGGRSPGSFPPPQAIAGWCVRKGLPSDNRTVYAICHAIYRDGIEARPIMGDAFERLDSYFDGWADRVFEDVCEELDKVF